MTAALPHVLWLVAVWVALWGDLSAANVLAGLLVASVVMRVVGPPAPTGAAVRLVAAVGFLGFFAVALVRSSLSVAARVLRPGHLPTPGIVAVPVVGQPDVVVTIIANSITLTPGTLTLDIRRDGDRATLYVHLLDLSDTDAARASLAQLGARAIAAFGHPQPLGAVRA